MVKQRDIARRPEILICKCNGWPSAEMCHIQFVFVNIIVRPLAMCCSFKSDKEEIQQLVIG